MTRSLNEVMTLATKAARGAGAPPAQAARFGQAAVAHLCAGRAPDDLDQALAALPDGPIVVLPLALARVCETPDGTGAFDDAGWPNLARSYVEALPFAAILNADGILQVDTGRPAPQMVVHRCNIDAAQIAAWNALASRTLVPESEASRLAGAGAGLTDND